MSIAVEFLDVVKQFPGAVEPAVDHVSFQIQEQEMITTDRAELEAILKERQQEQTHSE